MAKHALVEQPTRKPSRKITAAGVGGLLATVILSLADLSDVADLPTFWDSLISLATALATGYTAKARSTEAGQ